MVTRNKKLEARLKKNTEAPTDNADPKKKAPPPAAAKKEEPPKKDPKAAKGGPTEEELQAEAERLKREAEEEEKRKQEELERNFDKNGTLKKMGGTVHDFDVDDDNRRSQHYEWLLPMFYRAAEKTDAEINCQ